MKIQVGVGSKDEFFYFLDEGADEFYGGINDIPNHLYGGKNLSSIDDILELTEIAHRKDKKFFFVANEVRGDAFEKTFNTVKYLVKNGIDGVIIRDIALLNKLYEENIKSYYILSSLALCFNPDCLGFYSKLGIKRIAIPEHIKYEEAYHIIKNKYNIDTEMFLTPREYCVVLNGFCYLKEVSENCICRFGFDYENSKFFMPRFSLHEQFENFYEMYKAGVRIFKLGRHPGKYGHLYAKFVFKEIYSLKLLLEEKPSKKEFMEKSISIHFKFGELLNQWRKRKLKEQ